MEYEHTESKQNVREKEKILVGDSKTYKGAKRLGKEISMRAGREPFHPLLPPPGKGGAKGVKKRAGIQEGKAAIGKSTLTPPVRTGRTDQVPDDVQNYYIISRNWDDV